MQSFFVMEEGKADINMCQERVKILFLKMWRLDPGKSTEV